MVVIKDFFIYLQKEVFSVIGNRIWLLINKPAISCKLTI